MSDSTDPTGQIGDSVAHVAYIPRHVSPLQSNQNIEELQLEVLKLRDELIGCLVREGELRAQLQKIQVGNDRRGDALGILNHQNVVARNEQLEEQIDLILSSRTWRIGALLLGPAKPLRRILRKRG